MEITELLQKIKEVEAQFDEKREKHRFNIFTALHKERDEVNLHSRFISYLLSPKSGHGMKDLFAEIFVRKVLELQEVNFDLSNYEVYPNEACKSEFKEIDILLINKKTKQAIIIENKIYANDSNHDTNIDGYNGQLERYYNTILKGVDKNKNEIPDFQCDQIHIYYLTLYKMPSDESIGCINKDDVHIIRYDSHVRDWLEKCMKKLDDTDIIKPIIKQYLNLINKMTHNDLSIDERKALTKNVSVNWHELKYLNDNFKHIKWHTLDMFWKQLEGELKNQYFTNVALFPDTKDDFIKTISEVTHHNKVLNHGVKFIDSKGNDLYISGLGTLSWGITDKKWTYFKDNSIENIDFSSFTSENTYRLISDVERVRMIKIIIAEINVEIENDFKSLNDY